MTTEQYQTFKKWLIETNRIDEYDDPIGYLFWINRLVERRFCSTDDLFTIINNDDFACIFKLKSQHHYYIKSVENKDATIKLCFEYLNKNYQEYEEYEATQIFTSLPKNVLLLYSGNIICNKHKHPVEDISISFTTTFSHSVVSHANFCRKCNIKFMRK